MKCKEGTTLTHIYTFNNEESLTKKIDELKLNDVLPTKMTVVAKERPTGVFRNYHEIEFVKADGTVWEKLVGKLFDKNSEELVSRRFPLSQEEQEKYKKAINTNDIVLLVEAQMSEKYDGVTKEDIKREKKKQQAEENKNVDKIYDQYGLNSEKLNEKE